MKRCMTGQKKNMEFVRVSRPNQGTKDGTNLYRSPAKFFSHCNSVREKEKRKVEGLCPIRQFAFIAMGVSRRIL